MDVSPLSFLAALLMGFASSLHCAGMCGGIASTLTLLIAPDGTLRARSTVLVETQAGRILSYVLAGTLVGTFGSAVYGILDREAAYTLLRTGAALTLMWIGLSIAGVLPPLSVMDRFTRPLTNRIARLRASNKAVGPLSSLAAGAAWGFMPCAMVYGALLTAALTGSAAGGATFMLGFGLGTVPAVLAAGLGITSLTKLARGARTRIAVGLTITALGPITMVAPLGDIVAMCLGRL
ncbi:MAG: sulfite exporter TauE/SafE family protein [Labrys sp. (in: a-proteobacteria)]